MTNRVIIFEPTAGKMVVKIRLDPDQETVWLSLYQISELFERDKSVISRHISRILSDHELSENQTVAYFATVQKEGKKKVTRNIEHYNLDMILAIGYRVNSRRGTEFRKWATQILTEHLQKGYTLNKESLSLKHIADIERYLTILKQTLIAHEPISDIGAAALDVIRSYARTWHVLHIFDKQTLSVSQKHRESLYPLHPTQILKAIDSLKHDLIEKKEAGPLFGRERETLLQNILGNIEQTFDSIPVYSTVEERAAHLFYFIIKDHPFVDGNKRIGSFLMLLYLSHHKIPCDWLSNEAIISLALLVAQSNPADKDIMLQLISHLINRPKL